MRKEIRYSVIIIGIIAIIGILCAVFGGSAKDAFRSLQASVNEYSVTVQGEIPEDVSLSVFMPSDSVFDISLKDGYGDEWQPIDDGKEVEVTISSNGSFINSVTHLYDGKEESLISKTEEGSISFQTAHFSEFAVTRRINYGQYASKFKAYPNSSNVLYYIDDEGILWFHGINPSSQLVSSYTNFTHSLAEEHGVDVTLITKVSFTNDTQMINVVDASGLFSTFMSCTAIDTDRFNFANCTSMFCMFESCFLLESLDAGGWNTSSCKDMCGMFMGCSSLTELDVRNWNMSSCTNMSSMFSDCSSLTTIDVSNWNTSNCTDMSSMFYNCSSLTAVDVSNWSTSNCTDMTCMFMGCSSLVAIDVSTFDLSSVENLMFFLDGCANLVRMKIPALPLVPRDFFVPYKWVRYDDYSYEVSSAIKGMVLSGGSTYNRVVEVTVITGGNSSTYYSDYNSVLNIELDANSLYTDSALTISYDSTRVLVDDITLYAEETGDPEGVFTYKNNKALFTLYPNSTDTYYYIDDEGTLWFYGDNSSLDSFYNNVTNKLENSHSVDLSTIMSVDFTDDCGVIHVTNAGSLFYGLINCTSIATDKFDFSSCLRMSYMFYNCSSLAALDVSDFITTSVINMSYMFYNCSSLTELDVSGWDTSSVTDMNHLFYKCSSLTTLDVKNLDVSSVSDIDAMFSECSSLTTLDVSNWNTSSVIDMNHMFNKCSSLTTLDVSNFITTSVQYMNYMFNNCRSLKEVILPDIACTGRMSFISNKWVYENDYTTEVSAMLKGEESIPAGTYNRVVEVTINLYDDLKETQYTDYGKPYTGVPATERTGYTFDKFYTSSALTTVFNTTQNKTYDFAVYAGWKVDGFTVTFETNGGTAIEPQLVPAGDTIDSSVVPTKENCSFGGWYTDETLTTEYDFSAPVTADITLYAKWNDAEGRFTYENNKGLFRLYPNSTDTYYYIDAKGTLWFYGDDSSLNSYVSQYKNTLEQNHSVDVSTIGKVAFTDDCGVINVTDATQLFYGMNNCEFVETENFDFASCTDMSCMFCSCSSLTTLDVSGWDTSSCTNMSGMFEGCSSLKGLDVSGWDTGACTDMNFMFGACSSLTGLDVNGWDTGACESMNGMFSYCYNLMELDVSNWDTGACANMSYMFYYCSSLTTLDVSNWDTGACANMSYMFSYCYNLMELDVSNWDTEACTNMSNMFYYCLSLEQVKLPNISCTSRSSFITYKWVNASDYSTEVSALLNGTEPIPAGTYNRVVAVTANLYDDVAEIIYSDYNKGFTGVPTQQRDNYRFTKWYKNSARTTEYLPTSVLTSDTTLYAGWELLLRDVFVTQKIKLSDVNFDNGEPTFIYKLEENSQASDKKVYYGCATLTKDYATANVEADGYVSVPILFSNIKVGDYILSEEKIGRYAVKEVESVVGGVVAGKSAELDLVNNADIRVTFVSKRYESRFFSDCKLTTFRSY